MLRGGGWDLRLGMKFETIVFVVWWFKYVIILCSRMYSTLLKWLTLKKKKTLLKWWRGIFLFEGVKRFRTVTVYNLNPYVLFWVLCWVCSACALLLCLFSERVRKSMIQFVGWIAADKSYGHITPLFCNLNVQALITPLYHWKSAFVLIF